MSVASLMMRCRRGAAAAEMALVAPLLILLMLGSVELGNYFYNEHLLVKAVRDGARFAARQGFTNYDCSGSPGGSVVADTRAIVKTSLLSGGTNRLPNWADDTISVTESCSTTADSMGNATSTMGGIYTGNAAGAVVVTVTASVPYTTLFGYPAGFSGTGLNLNASQQSAVAGI